ncbi:MAG TPA: RloB family protein, partial [Candidatus Anaerostipes excrementavium]|nr:RloB family protein [Candidatus Anaerostipes excrementavium]
KLGYGIAFSNPCFEYWYLLHFIQHNAYLKGSSEVIRLLQNKDRPEKYEKNLDVFDLLLPHQSEAIERAKKRLEQLYRDDIIVMSRDSNPSTTVHRLVEYLNTQNQK